MVKSLTFMGSGAGVGTGEKTQETVKNGPALLTYLCYTCVVVSRLLI